MAELNVNIGNLPLKNPVMTASGTFGYGIEYAISWIFHVWGVFS